MSQQNGTCTHIKVTGHRCGSPALKGEQFCYFHQNAHRGVRRPRQSRLHPIALIEDEASIQYALMEVMNALMRNTIDLKRASLILRALHIAVKNASRVKYHQNAKDMVTQLPGYTEPTEEHEALALEADLPAVAANPHLDNGGEGPHYWERQSEMARRKSREDILRFKAEAEAREEGRKRFAEEMAAERKARAEIHAATTDTTITHVGAAAIGSPAKPQPSPAFPAAEAVPPSAPTKIPSHNFKPASQTNPMNKLAETKEALLKRKPPASATTAPKERKNAAQNLP